MSNDIAHSRPIFRLALFLVSAVLILLGLNTLYSFTNTLNRLDAGESERDRWQRPSDTIRALDLRPGNIVADLGSGSGYFSLKLSPAVGKEGQVLAVDLRRLSLFFLWTRALLRGQHNVQVIVGGEDNPRLPTSGVDAVLICNTYHEFSDPGLILNRVFRSLRPGGRLAVVDRAARPTEPQHTHEVSVAVVEGQLRGNGFQIVSRDDSSSTGLWMRRGGCSARRSRNGAITSCINHGSSPPGYADYDCSLQRPAADDADGGSRLR